MVQTVESDAKSIHRLLRADWLFCCTARILTVLLEMSGSVIE